MATVERALLSVSNKDGLVPFAQALRRHGVELVSSGGTAAALREAGLEVTNVSDYTGAPEILGGRVKTLHPRVFGGILARGTADHMAQIAEQNIGRIDLVVVNLYPFEQTISKPGVSAQDAVEQIDIGGPSLVRAAAKNHERVAIVVDPADYDAVAAAIEDDATGIDLDMRRRLATKAFGLTAAYDAAISNYLQAQLDPQQKWPETVSVQLSRFQGLRYGENPHQSGAFYGRVRASGSPPQLSFQQIQGKELSYNNIVDADGAWGLVRELPASSVCVIKHTNPCGAAVSRTGDVAEAFARALATDPVSAFGGIVACNRTVTAKMAEQLREIFLEAVIAPAYEPEALDLLRKKKKLRLLQVDPSAPEEPVWKAALGGILLQEQDHSGERLTDCEVVTSRPPTAREMADLEFAWVVCKHVKSNAIVFAKDLQLVGVGAGQMSRVDAVKLAASKAKLALEATVLASDAFFPFRDGVDEAAKAGATAIVQPGGSIRDEESVAAANEHGVTMMLTGVRHFRH
jgi:phosphoribosylaminoimidazolecarboxamide formyltransferase/IMP cyclohydrolase